MPIPVACQCGAKFAAKDELAGKAVKCPKCGQPLKIPAVGAAPATEAPSAGAKKPVATPSATKTPKPTPAPASAVADIFDEIGIVGSKTGIKCPNCNADMQPDALICIQCGFNVKTKKQIVTESDAKTIAKREAIYAKQAAAAEKRFAKGGAAPSGGGSYQYKDPAGDLQAVDYLLCILCSGIGLIVGIVYCISGNPKGTKMLGLSFLFVVIWNVLRFILTAAQLQQH